LWYHPREIQFPGKPYPVPGKTIWKLTKCKMESSGTNTQPPVNPNGSIDVVTTDIPPAPYGGDLITAIYPETGNFESRFTQGKRPLWGIEDAKEIGIRYNGVEAMAYGRWTFFRTGSFHSAAYGQFGQGSYVGLETSYRWP
jgi:hypothetical protein